MLLAFAVEFERETATSLAISANVLRVLSEDWVPVRDLLAHVGADTRSEVLVMSLQRAGGERYSYVAPDLADHPHTLLALQLHGQPLSLDHGYPARIISPAIPGVHCTKWVTEMHFAEVSA